MASGRLTAHAKDTYIAPGVSKFVCAAIPDMSHLRAESSHWIPSYILNVIVRAEEASPEREYRLNFLRRAVIADTEYDLARTSTLAFLDSSGTVFRHYFEAVHHWEQFLASSWLALDTPTDVDRSEDFSEIRWLPAYVFLASQESSYVNGEILGVTGGNPPFALYTDGLVERRDRDLDEGIGELAALLAANLTGPVDSLPGALVAALEVDRADDDIAILLAQVPKGSESLDSVSSAVLADPEAVHEAWELATTTLHVQRPSPRNHITASAARSPGTACPPVNSR